LLLNSKRYTTCCIVAPLSLVVVSAERSPNPDNRALNPTHLLTLEQSITYNVGNGRKILLLHGLFASKEQWHTIMCRLSEVGYQAIAPDLPGYGNSKSFALNDYALPNQATLLHKLMLGIKSFDLAGSSMGGAIAWLYAQRYPNQVHSLAFIGSPLGVVDWANSVTAIFQGINPFIPITKEQFALEIGLLFFTPPPIPDVVVEKVNDYNIRNRHYG
jgi:pimeloyl-ACP methyl ester carboxylesterase